MNTDDIEAIDFRKLRKEERRKAREARRSARAKATGRSASGSVVVVVDASSASGGDGGVPENGNGAAAAADGDGRTSVGSGRGGASDGAASATSDRRFDETAPPSSSAAEPTTKTPAAIPAATAPPDDDDGENDDAGQRDWEATLRPPRPALRPDVHRVRPNPNDATTVGKGPDGIYYVPNYLPPACSDRILKWLVSLPSAGLSSSSSGNRTAREERDVAGRWTTMRHGLRRVALFPSVAPLPPPLRALSNALVSGGVFPSDRPPNHVLVNEYTEGQGIMPHTDGPTYDPCTATLSLGGSDVVLKFTPRRRANETEVVATGTGRAEGEAVVGTEVLLEGNGSLVVFKDESYTDFLHGIDEVLSETYVGPDGEERVVRRGYRVSLTFRHRKSDEFHPGRELVTRKTSS